MTHRKDGRWQQAMTVNGRTVCLYGRTKGELLRKISEAKEARVTGPTFRTVAEEYWRATEGRLSPTVVSSYRRGLARAEEYFGGRRIREIRPVDVARYQDYLIDRYHPAAKTLANQMIVLRQIFRYGVRSGALDTDPARDVGLPRGLKKGRRTMASDEDVARIVAHRDDDEISRLAYLALVTGLRRGELLGLRQEDVDRETGAIRVEREAVYTTVDRLLIKPPKTEAGRRTVYAPVASLEKLTSAPFLFGGEEPLTVHRFQRGWQAYQQRTGVSCTLHQLRHNFASDLDEAGTFTDKEMQYLLGHSDVATTKNVYQELRAGRTEQLRAKLAAMR